MDEADEDPSTGDGDEGGLATIGPFVLGASPPSLRTPGLALSFSLMAFFSRGSSSLDIRFISLSDDDPFCFGSTEAGVPGRGLAIEPPSSVGDF